MAQRRVWVIDGEMYFSPNSTQCPGKVPSQESTVTFTPEYSRACEFQTPRWWTAATEWIGFVPTNPVAYIGAWFDSLAMLPAKPQYEEGYGYGLPPSLRENWVVVEQVLSEATRHLAETNKFDVTWPFLPQKWGYSSPHPTPAIANHHIECGRDWFSMWIGLLFWMTRKMGEDDGYIDGLMPPGWFIMVVQHTRKQAVMDSIRTCPLLQTSWKIARAGLWLRPPTDVLARGQPRAQWFVEQKVPVWYRWSRQESRNSEEMWKQGFLPPTSDEIQAATTWITPTITPSSGKSVNSSSFPASGYRPSLLSNNNPRAVSSSLKFNKKSGRAFWEPFFELRKERHEAMKKHETPLARQRREDQERKPPTLSAAVYTWDWDFDAATFTRAVVLKEQRTETLAKYSPQQKRYDSFFNEWDCCYEWGPSRTDDSDLKELGTKLQKPAPRTTPSTGPPAHPPALGSVSLRGNIAELPPPVPLPSLATSSSSLRPFVFTPETVEGFSLERIRYEVLEIATGWFGFVHPIPVPGVTAQASIRPGNTGSVSPQDKKDVGRILGLPQLESHALYFNTPLGKLCTEFVLCFASKPPQKPDGSIWDLSRDSWRTSLFDSRLNTIQHVQNKDVKMYMFDFGSKGTRPWKLAVYTAAAVMYVCRLPSEWKEDDIALDLVNCGIAFRTLQVKESLVQVPTERCTPFLIPMRLSGYTFDQHDIDFYNRQCQNLMSVRRSRAALLRGGFIRRIALEHIGTSDAIRGPSGLHDDPSHLFIVEDSSGTEYVDDELTPCELDILCGLYKCFTGKGSQVKHMSWFPTAGTFEGSSADVGRWTNLLEELYKKYTSILSSTNAADKVGPKSATTWRESMRGFPPTRRAKQQLEIWSNEALGFHTRL